MASRKRLRTHTDKFFLRWNSDCLEKDIKIILRTNTKSTATNETQVCISINEEKDLGDFLNKELKLLPAASFDNTILRIKNITCRVTYIIPCVSVQKVIDAYLNVFMKYENIFVSIHDYSTDSQRTKIDDSGQIITISKIPDRCIIAHHCRTSTRQSSSRQTSSRQTSSRQILYQWRNYRDFARIKAFIENIDTLNNNSFIHVREDIQIEGRKILWEIFRRRHSPLADAKIEIYSIRGHYELKNLMYFVTYGLAPSAEKTPIEDFLKRGLYDPRLLILIMNFCERFDTYDEPDQEDFY